MSGVGQSKDTNRIAKAQALPSHIFHIAQVHKQAYSIEVAEQSHPLDGMKPEWLDEYNASTEMGRLLRQADAKRHLAKLDAAEAKIRQQENSDAAIANECKRISADCDTAINFLLTYGIDSKDREHFRQVLQKSRRRWPIFVETGGQARSIQPAASKIKR